MHLLEFLAEQTSHRTVEASPKGSKAMGFSVWNITKMKIYFLENFKYILRQVIFLSWVEADLCLCTNLNLLGTPQMTHSNRECIFKVLKANHLSVVNSDDLTWDFLYQFLTPCNPRVVLFYLYNSKAQSIGKNIGDILFFYFTHSLGQALLI